MSAYDTALWAAADRHMSEGTGPEGVATITIQRAWLGLEHVELVVEAEAGESTGLVLEAHVWANDTGHDCAGQVDLRLVAPSALRVVLTADERDEVAFEVDEHAREQEEAAREYALELRCER